MSKAVIEPTWKVLPQREKYAAKVKSTPAAPVRSTARNFAMVAGGVGAAGQDGGWEYLDHTADVQIHAWGKNVATAFGACAVAMFGYMVDLDEFQNSDRTLTISAAGHDWHSMLFAFLDECLYTFHTESFVMREIAVTSIDESTWTVHAATRGSLFDVARHKQGTEIKAITYSNMQILQPTDDAVRNEAADRQAQVYVIVDI